MPKSTGPLQEQLGLGTANQSTPNNMTDNTTRMADKLGANKDTNAIPSQNPSVISSAGAIGKQCTSSYLEPHVFSNVQMLISLYSQPRRRNWPDWREDRRTIQQGRRHWKPVRCEQERYRWTCREGCRWAKQPCWKLKVKFYFSKEVGTCIIAKRHSI